MINTIMGKFDFDRLKNVITYYDMQEDYFTKQENGEYEAFNFDECFEMGLNEDEFPGTFEEFEKINKPIDYIVVSCSDKPDEEVKYILDKEDNSIAIKTDNFTMKEALTAINLVMEQQHIDNKWCHEVCIGHSKDIEHYTKYAQDPTAFGMWWNDFLKLFQEKQKEINVIYITIDKKHLIGISLELN